MYPRMSLIKLKFLPAVCLVFLAACTGGTQVAQVPTDTPAHADALAPPVVTLNVGESIELQGGESIPLAASVAGEGEITYGWKLIGVGRLEGDTTQSSIVYAAPSSIEEDASAAVTVIVRSQGGEGSAGVLITFVTPTPIPTPTVPVSDTKTPPDTPSPTQEPAESPTKAPTKEPTAEPAPEPTPPAPTATSVSAAGRPEWCVPFGRPPITNAELQGTAELTFPEDCAELKHINDFAGTSTDLPEDVHIWVLVFPNNRRYYPQSDDAEHGLRIYTAENGSWSVTTYLGSPDSGQEKFDIVVVLANEEASNFFSTKLQEWAADMSFPGLGHGDLPAGIMEVQTVSVMRTR